MEAGDSSPVPIAVISICRACSRAGDDRALRFAQDGNGDLLQKARERSERQINKLEKHTASR